MSDQRFAVIGLGQFGSAIAKNLSNRGAEVLAIDLSLEKVEGIKDEVSHAVALDATDKKALLSQNIQDVDAVVVTLIWTVIATYLILKFISLFISLRVDEENEIEGLDTSTHGESGYNN